MGRGRFPYLKRREGETQKKREGGWDQEERREGSTTGEDEN